MREKERKKMKGEKKDVESSFPYFLSPFTGLQAQSDLYIGDPTIINFAM